MALTPRNTMARIRTVSKNATTPSRVAATAISNPNTMQVTSISSDARSRSVPGFGAKPKYTSTPRGTLRMCAICQTARVESSERAAYEDHYASDLKPG
jgi:hypothetical protein